MGRQQISFRVKVVGRWSMKYPENSDFRQTIISSLIIRVNEVFFPNIEFESEKYTFYSHNR